MKQLVASAISPVLRRVKDAPHRDMTHVAMKEWLQLYVAALQTLRRAQAPAEVEELAKASLNATLLSSIWAPKWSQVRVEVADVVEHVTESMSAESTKTVREGGATWWMLPSLSPLLKASTGEKATEVELITLPFLNEPSLGGRFVAQRIHDVRNVSAGEVRSLEEVQRVLLPFTVACELKRAGYQSRASGDSSSMQERMSRLATLSSISQLLQLQADVEGLKLLPARVELVRPTDELDMLIQLPRLRASLPNHYSSSPSLSLQNLCEVADARVTFLAMHAQAALNTPVTMLVATEGDAFAKSSASAAADIRRIAQSCGVTRSRTYSVVDSSIPKTGEGNGSAANAAPRPPSVAVHRQVIDGCSGLARRFGKREENIRQSASSPSTLL